MFDAKIDCCDGAGLKPYEDCLQALRAEAVRLPSKQVPLNEAAGHVLAEELKAPISLPSFDNSAMDGFAFDTGITEPATTTSPASLPIVGASIAGDPAGKGHVHKGMAVKIMTGAPMPPGTNTVLPVEAASWDAEALCFREPYPIDKHVRHVGQDILEGSPVLKAGIRISSQHFPMLAALGIGNVAVYPRPRVGWISTGQELCDDFSEPLPAGHIYNATQIYGKAMADPLGYSFTKATTVKDTPQDFAAALDEYLFAKEEERADIILSTGGVSAGQYDFVKPVLQDAGAEIIFHKANIKPGKPVLFAKLPNGSFFFGLPGNPISTALALRAFVYPFIRTLSGLAPESLNRAKLAKAVQTGRDKTVFLMGRLYHNQQGELIAEANACQQSFQTAPFADSNAWLIVPAGTSEIEAGTQINCMPFVP